MTLSELQAQVALSEDSRRQFKQDMHSPDALAAEMAAFANSEGGVIFLGVADDGSLPGLSRADVSRLNQMISNVAAQHIRSPLTVQTENVDLENGQLVIALTLPAGAARRQRPPAARASCRLDELRQRRPAVPPVAVVAAALGAVQGRLVATQAVVENGGRIAGQSRHPSLASRGRVLEAGVDELHGFGFVAAPGVEQEPGVHQACVAGSDRNLVGLLDERRGRGELPGEQVHADR